MKTNTLLSGLTGLALLASTDFARPQGFAMTANQTPLSPTVCNYAGNFFNTSEVGSIYAVSDVSFYVPGLIADSVRLGTPFFTASTTADGQVHFTSKGAQFNLPAGQGFAYSLDSSVFQTGNSPVNVRTGTGYATVLDVAGMPVPEFSANAIGAAGGALLFGLRGYLTQNKRKQ